MSEMIWTCTEEGWCKDGGKRMLNIKVPGRRKMRKPERRFMQRVSVTVRWRQMINCDDA